MGRVIWNLILGSGRLVSSLRLRTRVPAPCQAPPRHAAQPYPALFTLDTPAHPCSGEARVLGMMLGRSLGLWCLLVLGARRQLGARGQQGMVVGTSRLRRVELLVVVDVGLAHALGGEVRPYVLALLGAADRLYRHPSLGSAVRLVVSRLEVVWDQAMGPRVDPDARRTLHAFCRWQRERREMGDWGEAPYDAALLLTRENLCQENFCESLGLGHIGTVCEVDGGQNCAVVQDIGLQSAFTVAHEIGHLIGMPHDNSEICVQMGEDSWGHQMMSPMLSRVNMTAPWSLCSFRLSLGFFASGRGDCLLNEPSVSLAESVPLAGTTYDRDIQCRFSYGPGFRARPGLDPCPVLWCLARHQGEWQHVSKQLPAADGTPCGGTAVCLRGKCTANWKQLTPVNGSWSSWGPWRSCSRSCGGGVQYSRRRCNNPTPTNFGHFCLGTWERFQSCNLESCPDDNGGSFRQEQCEARNGSSPDGTLQEWEPYYHGIRWPDLCKLNCLLKGTDLVTVFSVKVRDGTRCYPHSDAVCVRSQCVRTGCDGVIGSRQRYSRCGVCGGSDTDCERVIDHFRGKAVNYTEVVVIPRGAARLKVQQLLRRGHSRLSAYLAVRREDGSYAVNGEGRVTVFPSLIQAGGVALQYTGWGPRRDKLEALTHRPLTHALNLQVYNPRGRGVVRLTYSYYRQRQRANQTGAPGPDPVVPGPNPALVPGIGPTPVAIPLPTPTPALDPTLVSNPVPSQDQAGFSSPDPTPIPTPVPTPIATLAPTAVPSRFPSLSSSPEHTSPLPPAPTPGGALANALVCWRAGPWQLCSSSCGVGWVARRVHCVDGAGRPAQGCSPEQQPLAMALCVRGACQGKGRLRPKVKLAAYRPITHSRSKG
ncbi:A disintegrin and metalloproteinase with thrombospondin motifs 4 [Amblyraja radiata]|uniref:A disintegrin and metalloproteinase with thrombospondin motifs 4 n=1 Tax=Amblyraja radiata TaxID=386614 RepID=UPI0014025AF5|nr:A disintegrin and metalloproteinase with thrombospondin motifs 4 [Amblyraja radiata]